MLEFLIGALSTLLLMEAWLVGALKRAGALSRPIRVKSLDELPPGPVDPPRRAFQERIASAEWANAADPMDQCLGALRWAMNRVQTNARPTRLHDPTALLHRVEQGEGAICDGMAVLFQEALRVVRVPSRTVLLLANVFDPYDCHTSVEVFMKGRWVLLDPTFHLIFEDEAGGALSAQGIAELVATSRSSEIRQRFLGPVLYPVRAETYYAPPLRFFQNTFVVVPAARPFLGRCPILAYWFGQKLCYRKRRLDSDAHLRFWGAQYVGVMVGIPAVTLFLVLLLLVERWA